MLISVRTHPPATICSGVVALALLVAGCASSDPSKQSNPSSAFTSAPAPASSEPTQSRSSDVATSAEPNAADQASLDRQLREATWDNAVKRAHSLIDQGANVNAKDETEQSAYLITTSEGYLDLLNVTLDNGARLNDKDSWNGTGLIRAAERGHSLVVGRLLQAGIDQNHVNRIGYQAIHEAVWLGENTTEYVDTLRALVAGGVELDRASVNEGLTPLEMARSKEYPDSATVLERALDAAEIDRPNAALLRAAERGDADAVAHALRAEAEIETANDLDQTALLLAVTEDHVDVARLLVAMGADPDAVDHQDDTPWLVTGVTGSVPMLEALLPAKPDLTLLNRYGGTSVIPASERGHVDYVRRVLTTQIDVNQVNRLGWTALLEAVILGDGGPDHQEIVRLLLKAGADPSIADNDGVTAVQHAQRSGHTAVLRILRQNG